MARPAKREITDQEWEACEADHRRGETSRALSAKYDIPEATVRRRFASIPVNTGRKREIVQSIMEGKPPPKIRAKIADDVAVQAIADSVVMGHAATGFSIVLRRFATEVEDAPASTLLSLATAAQKAADGFRSVRELNGEDKSADDIWKAITGRKFEAEE